MSHCYSKRYRLRLREDFLYLRDDANFLYAGELLFFFKNSRLNSSETRIGISVSKKVGNAVTRNRLKRKVREYFRQSEFKNMAVDLSIVFNQKYIKKNSFSIEDIECNLETSLFKAFNKLV